MAEEREYHEIDANGDISLELSTVGFRVSSKVLSSASKLFEAKFLSTFQEGAELANNQTYRVRLADDDPDAMLHMLYIIHHKAKHLPTVDDTKNLLKILMLAAQYDCIDAVHFWFESQVRGIYQDSKMLDSSTDAEVIEILLMSYLMDQHDLFERCTHRVLFWMVKIRDAEFSNMLPQGLAGTLRLRQNYIKQMLWEGLETLLNYLLDLEISGSPDFSELAKTETYTGEGRTSMARTMARKIANLLDCQDCKKHIFAKLVWCLKSCGLSPLKRSQEDVTTLGSLAPKLQKFQANRLPEGKNCAHCRIAFEELIRQYFCDVLTRFSGLCLDCVKVGEEDTKPCRRTHDGYLGI